MLDEESRVAKLGAFESSGETTNSNNSIGQWGSASNMASTSDICKVVEIKLLSSYSTVASSFAATSLQIV